MKKLITFLLLFGFFSASAQQKENTQPNPEKKLLTVDASCGQCKMGLKGKGCSLAVKVDDKAYFVDGSEIDSHGDAHADDGFCNKVRKANVQGEIVNNRFKATYFKLLPEPKKESTN